MLVSWTGCDISMPRERRLLVAYSVPNISSFLTNRALMLLKVAMGLAEKRHLLDRCC